MDFKPKMNSCLSRYYRCPEQYERLAWSETHSGSSGYFRFGQGTTCYGSYCGRQVSPTPVGALHDALSEVSIENGTAHLPFDPSEAIDNLCSEAYVGDWRRGRLSVLSQIYYFFRPVLPVGVRRHFQKLHFRGWKERTFPHWPVDCSVDNLMAELMLLSLRASGAERIPFIWFWPEGSSSCAIMTHDVEAKAGSDFCSNLMDFDDSFGIKASFQIVPEERYLVRPEFLQAFRNRGFEIAIHDLNHDGHLYRDRDQFQERAAKINSYGKKYETEGFRAAVLYRKQVWYDALEFAYDMSVPNVAHLDPQRGGCCTVMPYFLN